MKSPIGQIFFFPRGDTFVKITAVADKPDPIIGVGCLMKFIDLRDGHEHGANFVEEIGEEFLPLPAGFAHEKIEIYLKARKDFEAARDILMDIDHEILLTYPIEGEG